jgi:hypothetical protein
MSMLAEIAIADYRLLFSGQGNQTSFSVFVSRKRMEVDRFQTEDVILH